MSEHIPNWIIGLFAFGSPAQELLNRIIPERFRPLALWAVAAGIVIVSVLLTPLDWDAFHIQLALVYAALTSGWALSKVVEPPLPKVAVALRAILIVGTLGATALFVPMLWAQHPDSVSAGPAAPAAPAAAVASFIWAQLSAFIGATLVRWLSPRRK